MIRTLLSLGTMVLVVAAVATGTVAFFGDSEVSTGNTFAAGEIDLQIDNESYYNGVFNDGTSWGLSDLGEGCTALDGESPCLFFNFLDLKPGDEGEDTISIHVETNDAWACMDIAVRDFDENGCTEPEAGDGDETCGDPGPGEGELQNEINFVWWVDDGDNVLESDEAESGLVYGPQSLAGLNIRIPLADNSGNAIFGDEPLEGGETYHVAKAWCFGELTLDPVPAGEGVDPTVASGIRCDGSGLDNTTQTDSVMGDISFEAMQSRYNPGFDCRGECEINTEETLIPDSGFENPEVNTPQQWDIFGDGSSGAWSVAWRDPDPGLFEGQSRPAVANLEIHRGVVGTPDEGDQYAELDSDWDGPNGSLTGEPASITIFQDIPTVPGRNYEIRFAFAPRPNTPASDNRLEVRWGGDVVHDTGFVEDNDAGIEWQQISVDVTATSSETRLSFTDLGEANSLGTFIDDVELFEEVCGPPEELAVRID